MSPEPLIELAGVDVVHEEAGPRALLRAVNWAIRPGEFWVVTGPPGGGKTALLLTAAGLNRPAAGTLRLFGRALAEATEAEQAQWRRRIGYVFEGGGRLLTHLSVADNIALPLRYHGDTAETDVQAQVGGWLERAGLAGNADALPSRLSPRLQQRAALARALVVPAEVLFVDQPAAGEVEWWQSELTARHAAGLTVVVGTNDAGAWRAPGRRVARAANEVFQEV